MSQRICYAKFYGERVTIDCLFSNSIKSFSFIKSCVLSRGRPSQGTFSHFCFSERIFFLKINRSIYILIKFFFNHFLLLLTNLLLLHFFCSTRKLCVDLLIRIALSLKDHHPLYIYIFIYKRGFPSFLSPPHRNPHRKLAPYSRDTCPSTTLHCVSLNSTIMWAKN